MRSGTKANVLKPPSTAVPLIRDATNKEPRQNHCKSVIKNWMTHFVPKTFKTDIYCIITYIHMHNYVYY